MKNVFIPVTLVLAIGYSLVIAARGFGLISSNVLGLRVFIGCFTAASLLAIVCHSYGGQRGFRAPKLRRRVLRPEPIADPFHATWTYQTISA